MCTQDGAEVGDTTWVSTSRSAAHAAELQQADREHALLRSIYYIAGCFLTLAGAERCGTLPLSLPPPHHAHCQRGGCAAHAPARERASARAEERGRHGWQPTPRACCRSAHACAMCARAGRPEPRCTRRETPLARGPARSRRCRPAGCAHFGMHVFGGRVPLRRHGGGGRGGVPCHGIARSPAPTRCAALRRGAQAAGAGDRHRHGMPLRTYQRALPTASVSAPLTAPCTCGGSEEPSRTRGASMAARERAGTRLARRGRRVCGRRGRLKRALSFPLFSFVCTKLARSRLCSSAALPLPLPGCPSRPHHDARLCALPRQSGGCLGRGGGVYGGVERRPWAAGRGRKGRGACACACGAARRAGASRRSTADRLARQVINSTAGARARPFASSAPWTISQPSTRPRRSRRRRCGRGAPSEPARRTCEGGRVCR